MDPVRRTSGSTGPRPGRNAMMASAGVAFLACVGAALAREQPLVVFGAGVGGGGPAEWGVGCRACGRPCPPHQNTAWEDSGNDHPVTGERMVILVCHDCGAILSNEEGIDEW